MYITIRESNLYMVRARAKMGWSLGVDSVVAVGCEVTIGENAASGKCSNFSNLAVGV